MLLETPYKIGDTVSFKLSSGEELVGRLESENDKSYTLNKPMVIIAQQQGLGLAPFMFSVHQKANLICKHNQSVVLQKLKLKLPSST